MSDSSDPVGPATVVDVAGHPGDVPSGEGHGSSETGEARSSWCKR
jgi:hypothetical protein